MHDVISIATVVVALVALAAVLPAILFVLRERRDAQFLARLRRDGDERLGEPRRPVSFRAPAAKGFRRGGRW